MKSKAKSKIIILITLGIVFGLSLFIITNNNLSERNNDTSSEYSNGSNLDNKNLKISAVSGKIHIDNNWTVAKAAGIVTGTGTYSDPYIIEDLVIDGGGSGSGIWIENSNVYFKIENCTIYYAGPSGRSFKEAGIKLEMVSNGSLINNNASNNNVYGLFFWYSNNNTISGNTVNNNAKGIYLGGSDRNTVSGNTANNNLYGIRIKDSNYNIVSGNTVNNNNENGIILFDSSNNTISGNTVNNNNENGIILFGSSNNTILGNTVNNNNLYGIRIKDSNYNIVSGNTLIGNYKCIFETNCYGNVIVNKNCDEDDGISFELNILIPVISGGVVIGVATILLIRRTLKGNLKIS